MKQVVTKEKEVLSTMSYDDPVTARVFMDEVRNIREHIAKVILPRFGLNKSYS